MLLPDDDFLFPVYAENKALFWFSRNISLWGSISFYLACLVNIAVAVFYPFGDDGDEGEDLCVSVSFGHAHTAGVRMTAIAGLPQCHFRLCHGESLNTNHQCY